MDIPLSEKYLNKIEEIVDIVKNNPLESITACKAIKALIEEFKSRSETK